MSAIGMIKQPKRIKAAFSEIEMRQDSGLHDAHDITDTISNLNLPHEGEAYLVYDDDNKIIVSSTEKSLFNQPLGSVYPELSPDAINELMKKEQASNSFSSVKLNHGDFFMFLDSFKA